jgi:hypothetical protein
MSGEGTEQDRATPEVPENEEGIEEFDDAALDKFLDEPPEDSESDESSEESETVTESSSQPEGSEAEGTPSQEEPASEEVDELALLKEKVATLSKQVEDKEQYIQERSREVGELRKSLRERAERLRGEVPDLMIEEPTTAIERILDARNAEEELRSLDMQETTERNKVEVQKAIPGFEDKIDAITEIAKADGVPPQAIRAFRDNPYAKGRKPWRRKSQRQPERLRLSPERQAALRLRMRICFLASPKTR